MDTLAAVTTISEAARVWGKHPLTVRRAIDNGRIPLRARKADNIWLITYESCRARWGEPKHPLNNCYNN